MCNNAGITLTGAILLASPAVNADASDVQSVIESEDWKTLKDIWEIIDQIRPADRFSVFRLFF